MRSQPVLISHSKTINRESQSANISVIISPKISLNISVLIPKPCHIWSVCNQSVGMKYPTIRDK